MEIKVCFKSYLLGKLTFKNGKYVYNSNIEGEKQFKQNAFSSIFYKLYNSKNLEFEKLPRFLKDYLDLSGNEFFIDKAKIEKTDSDFEKLYKLSFLKFDDVGFYITQGDK